MWFFLKGFRKSSAAIARDRLATLIAADRVTLAGTDLLDRLQTEFLNVIRTHMRAGCRVSVRQGVSRKLQELEISIDLKPRLRA